MWPMIWAFLSRRQDTLFRHTPMGVCVGAPLTVVVARTRPLKQILLGLAMIYIVGNLFASMSVNYWMLLLMRFVSGLPHGGILRRRFHCGGTGGREREGFAGGVADDSGDDHCQSVWCAFRHDVEQSGFVAFPLCVQYPLGSLDILSDLALDSVYARSARCRVERSVPFPEAAGTVADYPDLRCSATGASSAGSAMSRRR